MTLDLLLVVMVPVNQISIQRRYENYSNNIENNQCMELYVNSTSRRTSSSDAEKVPEYLLPLPLLESLGKEFGLQVG